MLSATTWLFGSAAVALGGAGSHRPGAHALRVRRIRPTPVAGAVAAGVSVGAVVAIRFGVLLGVSVACACATGTHAIVASRARSCEIARGRSLVAAVRLMAAELEAGSRPAAALRAGAEVSAAHASQLLAAAETADVGGDVRTALASSDIAPIGHAWHLATSTGAPAADVLSRVADDLDQRAEQIRNVAALTASPRASAALVALLPVLGVLMGTAMGAHPVAVLARGPTLLALGLMLDTAGVIWTRQLVARAQQP